MILLTPHRLAWLTVIPYLVFMSCGNADRQTEEDAAQTYEELVQSNIAARFNQQGDSVFERGEYHAAMGFYRQSMDSAAVQADSFLYYDSQLDLASVYDRFGEPTQAIATARPVVEAFVRSGDTLRIGRAYTALAGFYGKAGMAAESLNAAQTGFDFLKEQESLIHRCAAYNQMAFIFSDRGHWTQALPLLDTALQLMQASGILDQRPGMMLNLGDCYRNLGHWAEARRHLTAAATEADSLGQAHVHARALERLSQVAEATGDPGTALRLFRQAKEIRDSIFKAEKVHSLQNLQVQYETHEKEQKINLLQTEKQLQTAQSRLLLVALLALSALLGMGGFIYWLKLRHARQSLARKQAELADYVQLLLDKNIQMKALEADLKDKSTTKMPEDGHTIEDAHYYDESLYNNRILTERDWESFKQHFEQIYPGYLPRLRTKYPDLSGSEERLFLLIKLNLTKQEIADILGITANAVKKGRQRLRKRLGMTLEDDLDALVHTF